MEYIRAFITGGIICILVQILMDHTTLQPGRIMVILVITGVLLGALGIYKKNRRIWRVWGNSSAVRIWVQFVERNERSN